MLELGNNKDEFEEFKWNEGKKERTNMMKPKKNFQENVLWSKKKILNINSECNLQTKLIKWMYHINCYQTFL